MIDPAMTKAYFLADTGIDLDRKVDPKVVEENKRILQHKVRQRNVISCLIFFVGLIVTVLIGVVADDVLYAVISSFITPAVALPFGISANRLKQNACPKCFAISPWVHFKTWEINQQQIRITKEVETKHYAPDKKYKNTLASAYAPQYYQGKSVSKVSVPATRYDYRERYKCRCCGEIRDIYTHRIVE